MSDDLIQELREFDTYNRESKPWVSGLCRRAARELKALRAEVERLEAHNAKLWQDRYDALSVPSKDGLLSSEWIARTGRAERKQKAAEQKAAELQERVDAYANFTASIMSMARLNIDGVICLMSDSIDHAYRFLNSALNLQHKPTEADLTTKD